MKNIILSVWKDKLVQPTPGSSAGWDGLDTWLSKKERIISTWLVVICIICLVGNKHIIYFLPLKCLVLETIHDHIDDYVLYSSNYYIWINNICIFRQHQQQQQHHQQHQQQHQHHKLEGRSASGLEELIMGCTSTDIKEVIKCILHN